MPLGVHARPRRDPESQVATAATLAPEQRGHPCVAPVRKILDCRLTEPPATPVDMSAVNPAILVVEKPFTTQTGMPAASSGSGAPNVAPLTTLVCAWSSVHCGFDVAPHPVRHTLSSEFETTGKLWLAPVQPLSRSVPDAAATSRSSRGPPAGFAEHSPPPVLGTQRTLMTSLSFLGFALATATAVSVTVGDGRTLPFLFTFSGSRR